MKQVGMLAIAINITTPTQLWALLVLGGLAVWFGRGR